MTIPDMVANSARPSRCPALWLAQQIFLRVRRPAGRLDAMMGRALAANAAGALLRALGEPDTAPAGDRQVLPVADGAARSEARWHQVGSREGMWPTTS